MKHGALRKHLHIPSIKTGEFKKVEYIREQNGGVEEKRKRYVNHRIEEVAQLKFEELIGSALDFKCSRQTVILS